jgi:hypothetical protein
VIALRPGLIGRTEGNPFFLEESVRSLIETGAFAGERGAYRLVKAPEALQIPATVQTLLAARIDRLSPEDKRLLQTASVIGKDVPFVLLHAVTEAAEMRCIGGSRIYRRPSFCTRRGSSRTSSTRSIKDESTGEVLDVVLDDDQGRRTEAVVRSRT